LLETLHLHFRHNQTLIIPPGQERWISGYSDASWDSDKGQGGWGGWVRDSHQRIIMAAPCPSWVNNVNEAELIGVVGVIKVALKYLDSRWANILVVKTDSQSVCRWFGWKTTTPQLPKTPAAAAWVLRSFHHAHRLGVRLVVTWVKGHQGTGSTSGYLNDQVDRLAKAARIDQDQVFKRMPLEP